MTSLPQPIERYLCRRAVDGPWQIAGSECSDFRTIVVIPALAESAALAESIEVWHLFLPALGAAALIHLYWHDHLKRVLILSAVLAVLVLWLN